jgi:hypothetical protein
MYVCGAVQPLWTLDGGSAHRKASAYAGQHDQNKRIQISMPRVGFEPTIPAFERAKTVHALDRTASVIGTVNVYKTKK